MNEALSLSAAGLAFIAAHEGFRAKVYRDAAGFETIGYGHRLIEGERFPDGIREDAARRLLGADAARTEIGVLAHVAIALAQNQFDALVSLAFNIGVGAFAGSTLLRALNAGDVAEAADQFLRWDKVSVGGVLTVDRGLAIRRADERRLFLTGFSA